MNDDVDRLFRCFKCGISPPQSATRERKKSKKKVGQGSPVDRISACSVTTSPEPPRGTKKNALGPGTVKANNSIYGKQFSPVVFYGSPHGVPPKRPSSLLRLLREIRVDLAEHNKSDLRKQIWATFPRQDEAMKFAEGQAHVHVFSYQDHFNGQRRFLVSTYEEFWKRYKNMDPKFRHHYEVIQEGTPCHLYFDLEFNKKYNTEKNGDEVVDLLISVILEALLEKYNIYGDHGWIIELDSSTVEKFSRHVIVRIPKIAFKDNSHAGAFVEEICARILKASEKDERFEKLFINKDSNFNGLPSHLFVDTAVYSRNRCFRLALSSKAGKTCVLSPTGRFKCKGMSEENMFMESLICNMDVDCEKLLTCKMDLNCVKTLHFDTEESYLAIRCNAPQEFSMRNCTSNASTAYLMGKSPFPSLDAFVEYIASTGNIPGKIRCWYWFSEDKLMVYSMLRNRYCERIGREHKSNHVMYVVDLRRDGYYQKCYDPDCRGYRSPMRAVPVEVIPDTFFESVQWKEQHRGSTLNTMEYQLLENNDDDMALYNDEIIGDNYDEDSWWFEVMRVANDIENLQNMSNIVKMQDIVDEDDNQ